MVALVALSACEPVEEPIPAASAQLVVQGVLDASARTQIVFVDRTENGARGNVAIAGAVVELVTPQGLVMRLPELVDPRNGSGLGVYGADLQTYGVFRLEPGGTYTLRVKPPGGAAMVTGQTTVPGPDAPILLPPRSTFNRNTDTLRLSWPRARGAAVYQVTIESRIAIRDSLFYSQLYSVFADTSIVLPGTARTLDNNPVFAGSATATVIVNAVDRNYYDYYHGTTDPFAGAPPSKLSGGIGVFGSMSPVLQVSFPVR